MAKMRVGSLFSGIGGMDLGLERAGFEIAWQVEVDLFCNKVLEKHWPGVKRYGDITKIDTAELEPVDIVCGGFPCQPFSVAGKQRSKEDDRFLWPEMLRIIRAVRPTWVLGENVAGIVKLALDDVLSDLEDEGYATQTFIIPACGVNAPHRRDRVWIVAYAESTSSQQRCKPNMQRGRKDEAQQTGMGSGDVAHPRRKLFKGCKLNRTHELETGEGNANKHQRSGETCDNVAHAASKGLQIGGRSQFTKAIEETGAGLESEPERHSAWKPQSRVGRVSPRLPPRMDGHRWPAGLGEDQYDWEPPRLATGIPNRVARLKALGNAVIPQIVEVIGKAIIKVDKRNWERSVKEETQ